MSIIGDIKNNAVELGLNGAIGGTAAYAFSANPVLGAAFMATAVIADKVANRVITCLTNKTPVGFDFVAKVAQNIMNNFNALTRAAKIVTPFAVAYFLGAPATFAYLLLGVGLSALRIRASVINSI